MVDRGRQYRLRLVRNEPHTLQSSVLAFAFVDDEAAELLGFVPGRVAALSNPKVADGGETLIAIASPPSATRELEFLVKREAGAGEWLLQLSEGDEVDMSGPTGHGFPIDEHEGKDLLFVAIGTAIAPVRSAVRHAIERRNRFGRLAVVYGARSPENFAFAREFDMWRSADVKLNLTVTQPGGDWGGATGRVQDLLGEAVRQSLDLRAFVCGSEHMMDETTEALASLGVPRELVMRNY
jgi:sulfhydrogenase subunit gamma (sulfur reductase)